jgi:TonB-linked SusC/RagA family outer membrane protein
MRKLRILLPALAGLLAASVGTAQTPQGRITGTVTDQHASTPIASVQVRVQGMTIGATTDDQGRFVLTNIPVGTVTIVAQRLGYVMGQSQATVTSGGDATVNFSLPRAALALDQVVVVGYGTAERRNLTGAVDQVNVEQLAARPVPNLTVALQGMLPNVNIRPQDGKPIQSPAINIRGTTSIGTGGSALVLIDGVEGDPATINPSDIESVTALKDASSAAVYGARGAFGVVLITTKRPKANQFEINYRANYGLKEPAQRSEMVTDGYTFAKMFNEAFQSWQGSAPQNVNKTLVFSADYLAELKRRSDAHMAPSVEVGSNGAYSYYGSTDWYGLLYRDRVPAVDQTVSVSRGTENAQFMVSGRSLGQDGLFRYNSDDFSQKNLRANGSVRVTEWADLRSSFDYSNRTYHNPLNVGEGGGIWRNLQDEGHVLSTLFNPDGTLTHSAAYTVGDFVYGKNGIDFDRDVYRSTTELSGSFFDRRFRLTSDFTFQKTTDNTQQRRVPVPFSRRPGAIEYVGAATNDLQVADENTNYLATNVYGELNTTLRGKHSIRAMAGVNYEDRTWNRLLAQRNGLIFPDATDLNLALGTATTIGGGYEKWNILGNFTRLNYGYDDRYLLEFTGRYDGSSKFPEDQRFAFFPSVSGAWRVSREPFWKVSPKLVNDLRVRASWGSMGNGNVGAYQFQQTFGITQASVIVNGTRPLQTRAPAVLPDGLTWETATTTNVGLDVDMFSNRLTFSGDVYTRKTTDMYTIAVTPPAVFGASAPRGNYADLATKGWELSLGWQDGFDLASKAATYGIRLSLADNHAKILKYNNPNRLLSDYRVGQQVGEIWGYVTDGFFVDSSEILSHANQSFLSPNSYNRWRPGDLKFKDLNGDGKIDAGVSTEGNPGDRTIIGNTTPRYTFGVNLSGRSRGISVSSFFQGVGKQDWYPSAEADYFWGQYNRPYNNIPTWHLNPGVIWTADNPSQDSFFPRLNGYAAQSGNRQMGVPQTKYVMNVAYVRLKNLQVGYDLPTKALSRMGARQATVYVTAENLWTYSPLYKIVKNVDVENISAGSDRVLTGGGNGDGLNYPMMKSVTFGLSLGF